MPEGLSLRNVSLGSFCSLGGLAESRGALWDIAQQWTTLFLSRVARDTVAVRGAGVPGPEPA